MRDLQRLSDGHDRDPVVQVLDDFIIKGPNETHQALVFEMLGPPVLVQVTDGVIINERLDFDEILEMSVALLRALAYVHKAGHAHRGKITTLHGKPCSTLLSYFRYMGNYSKLGCARTTVELAE